MTVDETNSYLVTGDAEGVIKVWDISEYCAACTADDDSPPRKSTFDISDLILQLNQLSIRQ